MKEVVVVSGVRLPVGSYGGSLKDITAIDMGAMVVKEAVKRAGIQPSDVDEVVIGQVGEVAENGFIARAVSLKAGMPKETTAYSVNRQCGSGLQSIAEAVMEIQTGQADVVVAGGTENISRLPYYVNDARWGARMGHKVFEDGVIDILTWPLDGNHNGVTAENVAEKYHVTREEQDAFAVRSHQRACKAIKEGKFKDEILPVELKDRKGNITIFDTDEGPREGQSMEKLAKLRPCFVKGGTVTAANSSSLNDGAAAVVVMSKEKAEELGVTPKMKIEGYAIAGFDAELMGYSPKFSSEKLANKLGVDLKSIDMFEINEAFAKARSAMFEGIMIRLPGYDYECGKRSRSLLKLKGLESDEGICTDVFLSEKGNPVITIAWNGVKFNSTPPGSHSDRDNVAFNKDKYIGSRFTFEYREITDDGLPFHAVATAWRMD